MITINNGYIRLYRKLLENPIMYKPELLQLFIYCLLRANHRPERIIFNEAEVILEPGQFITGRDVLAAALNQNPFTTYKRLKLLEKLGVLSLKSNNKFTLVTVLNYRVYQSDTFKMEQPDNNQRTAEEQPDNTDKNDKNDKNDKKKYAEFVLLSDTEYQNLIQMFGELDTKEKIEALNLWKGSKGIKTSSDYYTILNWDKRKKSEKASKDGNGVAKVPNKGNFEQRSYTDEYFQSLYKNV